MLTHIDAALFRAYDIRGIVGKTLNKEQVFLIGKAFGSFVREAGEKTVCMARDGRLSGPLLAEALCDGLLAVGCEVIDLGMVPTPLLYYAANQLPSKTGIMLTGSHNPSEYNGLKMVVQGVTLAEHAIYDLYRRIVEERFFKDEPGTLITQPIVERYLHALTEQIKLARPLKVVLDAGNGVAGAVAPQLFRALGCIVETLYCEVDGHFPNHHPDPSDPKNLQDLIEAVRTTHADIGLAFDGDGDRLGVVTNQGEIIWPDRVLMLYAKALLATSPQAKIIYDVKCTQHLADYVRQHGGEPFMWKTGHSLIKTKMRETNALLAGEMSGHFFFKDRFHGGDDALYAGARLLEILAQSSKDSATLFNELPNSINTPELKVAIAENEKFSFITTLTQHVNTQTQQEVITLDGLRVHFKEGWGLVRASNTSPYLILRFEAINHAVLSDIQTLFKTWMLTINSDLAIPF